MIDQAAEQGGGVTVVGTIDLVGQCKYEICHSAGTTSVAPLSLIIVSATECAPPKKETGTVFEA